MSHRVAIEVGELARLLDARAGELAPELLPNGRRQGIFWRTGSVADEPGQSLAVNLSGPGQGRWTDFSEPEGARRRAGDMLALATQVLFNGDRGEGVRWAISRLGLDGLDPGRIEVRRAEARAKAEKDARDEVRRVERMRRKALNIWLSAVAIDGTPAELYLASRGIDLSLLDEPPGALRYKRDCWCEELETTVPALVAAVVALDGTHVATHRIYLEPDGRGGARKHSRLVEPKKAIGRFWGGHVSLNKGDCGRMTLREVPAGTAVAASEGIEDGLTVACAVPSLRVVAGVTLGNLGALALPDQVRDVTLIAQNDPSGSAAERTLAKVISARQAEGRTVRIARPPAGTKDANDLLRFGDAEAAA